MKVPLNDGETLKRFGCNFFFNAAPFVSKLVSFPSVVILGPSRNSIMRDLQVRPAETA